MPGFPGAGQCIPNHAVVRGVWACLDGDHVCHDHGTTQSIASATFGAFTETSEEPPLASCQVWHGTRCVNHVLCLCGLSSRDVDTASTIRIKPSTTSSSRKNVTQHLHAPLLYLPIGYRNRFVNGRDRSSGPQNQGKKEVLRHLDFRDPT